MSKYYDCRLDKPFTGWVIGNGGNLHARLYEKVIEIVNKSRKTYLFWVVASKGLAGWRKGLAHGIPNRETNAQGVGHSSSVRLAWTTSRTVHCLTRWLRLSIPNPNDSKRDRWPNHPLWGAIAGVYALPFDQPLLQRFRPARLPADERLFVHGLGGLTSFMASRGIEDFGEGLGEYLTQATEFHAIKGEPFQSYIGRKVKAKARKYNTIHNQKNLISAARELKVAADAYGARRMAMMETLNLEQAAAFLHLHPVTLQRMAQRGAVPAAKLGRRWIFLDIDLVASLRAQYPSRVMQGEHEEVKLCRSTNATILRSGGSSYTSAEKSYREALCRQGKSSDITIS